MGQKLKGTKNECGGGSSFVELVDIITVIEDLTLNLEKDFVSNVFVAKNISLLDYYFVK